MARTVLTVTTTAAAGTVLPTAVAVDAANGNSFPNTGREMIEVTNGAGAPVTLTITTYGTYAVGAVTYAIADPAISITNATSKVFGPFDKTLYNNTTTGHVDLDWSSGTSITARVIALGTA